MSGRFMEEMMPGINHSSPSAARALTSMLVAMLAWWGAAPAAQSQKSAATITGAFADSCRDFSAHSSKDISYVELQYVGGLVIKSERINSHDHAIDGHAGEEIALATVKSGTTIEEFACVPSNRAPTALLEIQTPPVDGTFEGCFVFWSGGLACEQTTERTAWTNKSQIPDTGGTESGWFRWVHGLVSPCLPCPYTVTFRGIGSSDPDGDIASWSLDFGDGTSVNGTWSAPPTAVEHDYGAGVAGVITLTVTDSAGQSHSDSIVMYFLDLTPE
jgi:hypothetical protein